MKNSITSDHSNLDVQLIDTSRMCDYLRSRNWIEKNGVGRGIARVFERSENKLIQVVVPKTEHVDDYEYSIQKSISAIAKYEKRDDVEVYFSIVNYANDVLQICEISSDTNDGTISFHRIARLFNGIRKSLLSLAHLEIDPKAYYSNLQKSNAELFLNQCRLGQTEKGSYRINVSCPLNAVAPDPNRPEQTVAFDTPFTRRVTNRLAQSIELLNDCASHDDYEKAMQTADPSTMLCTNLCDGLLELSPEIQGNKVEIGFRWASKLPQECEKEKPTVVGIDYSIRPFIETVSARLRTLHVPEVPQYFIGKIESLAGKPNASGHREGNVVLKVADEENETRKVRIDLNEADHAIAWNAYPDNKVVAFKGVLKRLGGETYRIDNYSDFMIVDLNRKNKS